MSMQTPPYKRFHENTMFRLTVIKLNTLTVARLVVDEGEVRLNINKPGSLIASLQDRNKNRFAILKVNNYSSEADTQFSQTNFTLPLKDSSITMHDLKQSPLFLCLVFYPADRSDIFMDVYPCKLFEGLLSQYL